MDKSDGRFRDLRGACDTVSRKLREVGVGADVEEQLLWSTGTIGTHSPLALVRAVFFYVGKTLCLRGGTEQRSLKPSQFRRESNRYVYVENGSKNHQGAFGKGKSGKQNCQHISKLEHW